jgi:hypothetical protein
MCVFPPEKSHKMVVAYAIYTECSCHVCDDISASNQTQSAPAENTHYKLCFACLLGLNSVEMTKILTAQHFVALAAKELFFCDCVLITASNCSLTARHASLHLQASFPALWLVRVR